MMTTATPATRSDPRNAHWTRRLGYRLLPGDGYSYVLHMRPREWPIVAAHALFGFLLALPESPEVAGRWPIAAAGIFFFVVLLNGGTLAINSAYDQDAGDIGYLDTPPPPPSRLFGFGMALMIAGLVGGAVILPLGFTVVYAACLVMSVLYSVPPFRWKAVAGLDLVINAIGFGALTAVAGWTLTEVPIPPWAAAVLLAFAPLFAALYPLTQLYQVDEDRSRGDRTLAIALGTRTSLIFSLVATIVAFAMLFIGLALRPQPTMASLLLLPLAAWVTLLLRWLSRFPTMSADQHKRGMYLALRAWALTNIAVLAAVLGPHYG